MFRIHFDPKTGCFVIQVRSYVFFWTNVTALNGENDGLASMVFKTFDDASSYVKSIGLDKLYRDRSICKFDEYMADHANPNDITFNHVIEIRHVKGENFEHFIEFTPLGGEPVMAKVA